MIFVGRAGHASYIDIIIYVTLWLVCRYEVNPSLVPELEASGMQFVGRDETGERMEILEVTNNPPDHPFFVAAQFHPEFKSR